MKWIKPYKLNESSDEYSILMGKLLHVYGSIPLPKEKASVVIKKMIFASRDGVFYTLGEDVDINYHRLHDKIRFTDYFDSLIRNKDTRGHNFEGLISGLYNGDLSTRGVKYDVSIDGKKYSVKFVDNKGKAPEIGRFKSIIQFSEIEDINLKDIVKEKGGLTLIFRSEDTNLKKMIWDNLTKDIDAWILAYPNDTDSPEFIRLNIIEKDEMYKLISGGCVVSPKGGIDDIFSLALSTKYITKGVYKSCNIKIPYLTVDELRSELKEVEGENWSTYVFGEMAYKMRPDVLRWIKKNKQDVIKRLNEM